MTNNEAAKWIQLYIDLAKIDPTTGEAAYLNDDDKKTIEAMEMAVNTLTAQPEGWLEQNKDKILQAGMEGREIDFRIGGRLFAIREKAQ